MSAVRKMYDAESEDPEWEPVAVTEFSLEALRRQLLSNAFLTVRGLGLESRLRTPALRATLRFLEVKAPCGSSH